MQRRSISPDWTLQRRARMALTGVVVAMAVVALSARSEASTLSLQCPNGSVWQCESSVDSSPSYDANALSEITFDARDDLFGPMTAIDAPGPDAGGGARPPAADFLQIAFALQRSATPQAVLDVLTSGAWQSSLYATSMDFGREGLSDPFVSTPHPAPTSPTPVPEPASLLLFGSGLAGLAGVARRLRRRKAS